MGSDHYCLRWNNHQSNLLGVFSQLLRDESLVDVTLACSEGHSIRAHKVVLSACSSYFQTLFIDHPARHPIVILKDVRFAELSTLIEFMYHGEVNVEHCQLSELLRTAESLKVKGLTDMTNLGPPPVNLQAPSQHVNTSYTSSTGTSTSSGTASGTATMCGGKTETIDNLPAVQPEQTEPTELINKKRVTSNTTSTSSTCKESQLREGDPMVTATTTCTIPSISVKTTTSSTPISLLAGADRKTTTTTTTTSNVSDPSLCRPQHQFHMPPIQSQLEDQSSQNSNNKDSPTRLTSSPHAGSSIESETLRPGSANSDMDDDLDESDEDGEDCRPSDMRLTTTRHSVENSVNSVARDGCLVEPGGLSNLVLGRSGPSPLVGGNGSGEPIAGPSNIMPPVQQVPLSLKKQVDWGGGSADEKSNIESPSDYPRHSLDPDPTTSEGLMQQAAAILQQAAASAVASAAASSSNRADTSSSNIVGPAHLYQCIYCNTAFPHQSKLTRHILSHSLETLKYREQLATQHSPLLNLGVTTTHSPTDTLNLTLHSPLNLMDTGHAASQLQSPMDIDSLSGSGGVGVGGANDTPGVVLCKFCGKSFPDVSSLIGHLPVHTGDRPFKCEFCGKAFKLRHHMKDHCRVHTGERPFRCSLCGKTFSRSTILKAHEKTHYPKYVRKFLSPSPLDTEEDSPH